MDKTEVSNTLIQYIRNELGVNDGELAVNCDLFEDGVIDSMHLESFFAYIEDTFDMAFREDDFFDERISTIDGIGEIILEIKGISP